MAFHITLGSRDADELDPEALLPGGARTQRIGVALLALQGES